ncbi:hypothetical protein BOX15_Mlig030150g3 [Macrostomum lignano]|uniref:Uncharacterized protein n=1 Tax=Macrostomum lignano TaxID=282301 RepID=A0A267DY95_9PLAT|nr:hypothetical protein BOX15_Mlig030150g3 [Macrostomum lignano]
MQSPRGCETRAKQKCAKEVKDENSQVEDCGKLFASVESWLDEACSRSEKFSQQRDELRDRQSRQLDDQAAAGTVFRCVGDVTAGVEQLQFEIDRHLTGVMRQCWLDDREASPVLRPSGSISDLPSSPRYLALCSNTRGFAADPSGRIVRIDASTEACEPLPDVCVAVSLTEKDVEYILLMSLDGSIRFRCQSELDWSSRIFGLQCDSSRQQLYVAQANAVTAIDLSGQVVHLITRSDCGEVFGTICSVDCSLDKIFILSEKPYCLVAFSKDSFECELNVDISPFSTVDGVRKVSLQGHKALLCNQISGQLMRICCITGQLIMAYPVKSNYQERFFNPQQVLFNGRGLLLFSDSHCVRIMAHNGAIQQTLGTPTEPGCGDLQFKSPIGTCIVTTEKTNPHKLFFADLENLRICVFELYNPILPS